MGEVSIGEISDYLTASADACESAIELQEWSLPPVCATLA